MNNPLKMEHEIIPKHQRFIRRRQTDVSEKLTNNISFGESFNPLINGSKKKKLTVLLGLFL